MNAGDSRPELNPYAPPATEDPAEQRPDELQRLLKKVHEDCGALAVAWGLFTGIAIACGAWLGFLYWILPPALLSFAAVVLTWRIRPAGVILGLVLTYLVILSPVFIAPGVSLTLGLFLCPLLFQGHRILRNAAYLQRMGVILRP